MKLNVKKIAILSVLAAISIILVYFIRIPLFVSFLEYDPSDIPILIGALAFGPSYGFILTIVVSFVQAITVSAASGIIGAVMHIFATGTLVIVSSYIYKRLNNSYALILSFVFAIIANIISMVIWNLVFTPIFLGVPISEVLDLMLVAIVPFNLVRGVINCTITFIVYKSIGKKLTAFNT